MESKLYECLCELSVAYAFFKDTAKALNDLEAQTDDRPYDAYQRHAAASRRFAIRELRTKYNQHLIRLMDTLEDFNGRFDAAMRSE